MITTVNESNVISSRRNLMPLTLSPPLISPLYFLSLDLYFVSIQEWQASDDGTEARRIILVLGTGHGGWCWYRVTTLLCVAGHRVDAPDLAASGTEARPLHNAPTFEDYRRSLLDLLCVLLAGEKAVLAGHSFGVMSVALAAEVFPEKVMTAVFVTAFMPDCTNPRSHVSEQVLRFSTTCMLVIELAEDSRPAADMILVWLFSPVAISVEASPVGLGGQRDRLRARGFLLPFV
ncbi:salicylic acid-binding protein 2-like [Phragmites australis]|uniref:salicylic acid-binding protein 2-like n=1 Tax=Phragmites australis TaxID=29695 RepID=UPI002D7A32EC|nr:salicylic acid-binding protein 2-like [Phragmites australis]